MAVLLMRVFDSRQPSLLVESGGGVGFYTRQLGKTIEIGGVAE